MRTLLLVSVLVAALAATADGETLNVPKDYVTIQEAVDNAGNGDVIKVKKGTYPESVEISLLEDVTLKASGQVTIDGEGVRETLRIGLVTNVKVIGFTIANSSGAGIYVAGAESVKISKCTVVDSGQDGILATSCRGLRIDKCTIEDTESYGIEIEDEAGAPASMDCGIHNCRFSATGEDAILFESGEGHLAEKNRIENATGNEIQVLTPLTRCIKNRIENVSGDGIVVNAAENCAIEKNRIQDVGGTGVNVRSDDVQIMNNKMQDIELYGVDISGTDNLIEKNKVKDCRTAGFRMREGENTLVKNKAKKCETDIEDADPDGNFYDGNSFDPPT